MLVSVHNLLFTHSENTFETNFDSQWKIHTLQQCKMQEIIGEV